MLLEFFPKGWLLLLLGFLCSCAIVDDAVNHVEIILGGKFRGAQRILLGEKVGQLFEAPAVNIEAG